MLSRDCIPSYMSSLDQRGFVETRFDLPANLDAIIEPPLGVPTVNGRKGYVQSGNTRFLSLALTWGRAIIEIYTNPALIALADCYAGTKVHLSNYRIYRTFPSNTITMQWHVDNKIDTYDAKSGRFITQMVHQDKGLILILYLSDVADGGLQLVAGSHQWSTTESRESWDDRADAFGDKVVTFNDRPKGTAILYDYRAIHRAKPYTGGVIRTSLFAQYSPSWMPTGEPILLNARDIADLSDTQKRVLNFGRAPSTENWPIGDPAELVEALDIASLQNRISLQAMLKEKLRTRCSRILRSIR